MAILRFISIAFVLLVINSVNAQQTEAPTFVVNQYIIEGDNPLGSDLSNLLEPYLGEHFGIDGLSAAVDEVSRALQNEGFSFHRGVLPPQTLDSGTVYYSDRQI